MLPEEHGEEHGEEEHGEAVGAAVGASVSDALCSGAVSKHTVSNHTVADPLWWHCASPYGLRGDHGIDEAAIAEHAYRFLSWLMERVNPNPNPNPDPKPTPNRWPAARFESISKCTYPFLRWRMERVAFSGIRALSRPPLPA